MRLFVFFLLSGISDPVQFFLRFVCSSMLGGIKRFLNFINNEKTVVALVRNYRAFYLHGICCERSGGWR